MIIVRFYRVMEQDLTRKRKRLGFLGENGENWLSDFKDSIVDIFIS